MNDAKYVCDNASGMEQDTARILGYTSNYHSDRALRQLMDLDLSWCMYDPKGLPFMAGGFRFASLSNVVTVTASTSAWADNVKNVTYDCRHALMEVQRSTHVRRIECWSLGSNVPAHRWYQSIGFHKEATLEQYGPRGESVCIHAITTEK